MQKKPPYHHGSLPEALLDAAECILVEEGLDKLSLRATARLAGVSHAAPKNHFENLTGLLSALAARGYTRFKNEILERLQGVTDKDNSLKYVGLAYVAFARDNPELFLLMFRSQSLDYTRPDLSRAAQAAFSMLANPSQDLETATSTKTGSPNSIIRSWSLVHGFAMLMIDGKLDFIFGEEDMKPLSDDKLYEILFEN